MKYYVSVCGCVCIPILEGRGGRQGHFAKASGLVGSQMYSYLILNNSLGSYMQNKRK
jgi:hypothetical protein